MTGIAGAGVSPDDLAHNKAMELLTYGREFKGKLVTSEDSFALTTDARNLPKISKDGKVLLSACLSQGGEHSSPS